MLRTILVPLDATAATDAATGFATTIAQSHGISLTGLGVVDVPTICAGASAPVGGASFKAERDAALIEDARTQVASFVATFEKTCGEAGVAHRTQVEDGLPYKVINRVGREHDMIVVGRDTCFHFETSDQPGETLGHLVQDSTAPLCVVPKEAGPVTTVLMAIDDTTPSAHTVQLLAHLRLFAEAAFVVVSVDADAAVAQLRCDATADYLRRHDLDATSKPIVSSDRASTGVLEAADSSGAGMIAMGAHGGGVVHKLFYGSTTRRILRDTRVPVFIHH